MDKLLAKMQGLLETAAGATWSEKVRFSITIALGVMGFVLVLQAMGSATKTAHASTPRSILMAIAAAVFGLVGATVAAVYLAPAVGNPTLSHWTPLVGLVVAMLVLVVPLHCVVARAPYAKATSSILVAAGAAAAILLIVSAAFDAISSGSRSFGSAGRRTAEVNEIIDQ